MKAYLMHPDRDFDLEAQLPANADALERDLELPTLYDAMARGDDYLRSVARSGLLLGLTDPDAIRYRQRALADCLEHPTVIRQLYALAVKGVDTKRDARFFWFRDSPDSVLQKSVGMLQMLTDVLRELRRIADDHSSAFCSQAFTELFATLQRDLDDAYLQTIDHQLKQMRFRDGTLISATLGRANRGTNFVLRKPQPRRLIERITAPGRAGYSFTIADRDEYGMQALAELRGRGVNHVANALAQATDHVLSFCKTLRAELAFYVGCLNLHEQLTAKQLPTCFPTPEPTSSQHTSARSLYDAALAFHLSASIVGNDIDADGTRLMLITGANQGGKSTFLRSLGLAQLMMQAGMYVTAETYQASVVNAVFTHFKREEDPTMTQGKLDEELHRMSDIADQITPACLLLCNESFAATNEREGSEIARQVIHAMLDVGVKVYVVTHLYDLADSLYRQKIESARFLRAERLSDGTRTFRVTPGPPLPTSHGQDSYRRIFAAAATSSTEPPRKQPAAPEHTVTQLPPIGRGSGGA